MAVAIGCVLSPSTEAADLMRSSGEIPGIGIVSATVATFSVRVPVLSKTTASESGEYLEGVARTHQDPEGRGAAGPDHDRDGCRESHGAGTGDEQQSNPAQHGLAEIPRRSATSRGR